MPTNFWLKTLKLWKADIEYKLPGDTSADVLVRQEASKFTSSPTCTNLPASGHFVDEEGNESKPVHIKGYTAFPLRLPKISSSKKPNQTIPNKS
jgi:hypothetical protein